MDISRLREMEALARKHAQLDEKTAARWTEEAKIYARLVIIEERAAHLKEMAPKIWERAKKSPAQDGAVSY